MKNLWETVLVAFGMFSRVPVKTVEWTKENRRYSMLAFPLVGVLLGLCWFLLNLVCKALGVPTLLTGAFLTGLPLLLAGGIHLDGYADTCDALGSHGDREKKLAVMKDPHIGSFAAIHLIVYFILWFAASALLAEQDPAVWGLTALIFVLSRTLSGLAVATFPMAKGTGLAHSFAEDADKKKVRNGLLALLVLLVILVLAFDILGGTFPAAFAVLAAAAAMYFWYRYIANKHFGGISGDLAGWFLCRAELWMLLAAALGATAL